jgi:hypothetical protein
MRLATDSDITLSSRFECKYIISPLLVPQIREFIQPFMRPDRFANAIDASYEICSLYLDTDDLQLYQQTVSGEKKRFKLRVRTYSDDPQSPVFFEVKRRLDGIVQKRRARIDRRRSAALLASGVNGWLRDVTDDVLSDIEYFSVYQRLSGAKPLIRVKYRREAYEPRGGDPARITIDTALQHCITLDDTLSHETGRWVTTPVEGTILELKFTERYPPWFLDLVHLFGLKQQPVPKYVMSVDHVLLEGRATTLAVAGFTMPPRRA